MVASGSCEDGAIFNCGAGVLIVKPVKKGGGVVFAAWVMDFSVLLGSSMEEFSLLSLE